MEDIIDDNFANEAQLRRDLLPLWIKIFTIIFLILGVAVPVAFLMGVLGYYFTVSM